MKRRSWIFLTVIIVALLSACNAKAPDIAEPESDNGTDDIAIIDETDSAEPESEIGCTVPAFESPESLSLDMDKITDYHIGLDPETYTYYAVNALQKKYPDLVLIDSDYKGKPEDKDAYLWHGMWQSEMSGMSYWMTHHPTDKRKPGSFVYEIYGRADSLIIGLTDPVEASVCMQLLGIPEEDWAIGKAPIAPNYDYYSSLAFDDILPEDFCFVINDDITSNSYGEKFPFGIIITMSTQRYISPCDEFVLKRVGWAE